MKTAVLMVAAALALTAAEEAMPNPPVAKQPLAPAPAVDWRSIDHVVRIEVTMPDADWEELRMVGRSQDIGLDQSNPVPNWSCEPFDSPFDWFEATVSIDGKEYKRARIRKKGFYGSLSTDKPSLKLRLDKYINDQDHFGTTRMTLNNSIQDKSLVNTCLTYELFRRAGIPAPLCNYAKVAVNGDDLGTYVNVEDMKTDYFDRVWDGAGNLYEGTFSDFRPQLTGTFEKKTENPGLGDIDKLTEAIASDDVASIERLVDVDRFLTYWALESLVGFHDGYTEGINNYYFHESADGLVFIPYGPDQAFVYPKSKVMNMRGALARALYSKRKEAYKRTMRRLLATVWNEVRLLGYVGRIAEAVGDNADTMRVVRFIGGRREWVEGRLKNADFDRFFAATGPYTGNCNR